MFTFCPSFTTLKTRSWFQALEIKMYANNSDVYDRVIKLPSENYIEENNVTQWFMGEERQAQKGLNIERTETCITFI